MRGRIGVFGEGGGDEVKVLKCMEGGEVVHEGMGDEVVSGGGCGG